MKWEIQDDNGKIYEADNEVDIRFIWNCITNDIHDLERIYPHEATNDLIASKRNYVIESSGLLKLVEIKEVYTKLK